MAWLLPVSRVTVMVTTSRLKLPSSTEYDAFRKASVPASPSSRMVLVDSLALPMRAE